MTGLAATVACAFAWATLDVLRKSLVRHLEPLPLLVWLCCGQALVAGIWVIAEAPGVPQPAYYGWTAASIAVGVAANLAYLRGLERSPFSVAIPLLAFVPVWTALFGIPLLGQLPTTAQALGVVAVVAGAASLGDGGLRQIVSRAGGRGRLDMLLAALGWALTIVLDRRALAYGAPSIHTAVLNAGIGISALVAIVARGRWRQLRVPRQAVGGLVVASIVAASALGLQFLAIRDVLVAVVEAVKRTVGIGAAVLVGRWLFAEAITRRRLAAVALMAAGAVVVLQPWELG